MAWVKWVRLR